LAEELVAPGFGRSAGLMRRTRPGLSACQSPNAALPVSGPDWPAAGAIPAPATSVAKSSIGNDDRKGSNSAVLNILDAAATRDLLHP
jgi:hypothetical protein